MKYLATLLALLFLSGCCGIKGKIAVDDTFSETEFALFNQAIDEWVVATDSEDARIFTDWTVIPHPFTMEQWHRDKDYGILFRIHTTDPGYQELIEERGNAFAGIANNCTNNIAIRIDAPAFNNEDSDIALYGIMLHELGHVYGLGHDGTGLMSKSLKWIDGRIDADHICIHQSDLDHFCEINYCGPDAKSTCK